MSISRNCVKTSVILSLFLLLASPAKGFSRQQRLKIYLPAPRDAKSRIDSIARSVPGVYTAQWKAQKQCLFVVYDRTRTTKKIIIASLMRGFQKENHNFADKRSDN